jgi:hypothetical protein
MEEQNLTAEDIAAKEERERQAKVFNETMADANAVSQSSSDQQQQQSEDTAKTLSKVNDDGSLKPTQETMDDPKDFGITENIQDGANAVVAGLQDSWNNTVDLGKFFDPAFYQKSTKEDPYEFKSDWKFDEQPIVRTRWGKLLRGVTDIGVGFIGVGKIGTGIKGARALMFGQKAAKAAQFGPLTASAMRLQKAKNLGKTFKEGAIAGALVDAWDSDSHDANMARTLIEINPSWAPTLEVIATNDDMSPAQRSLYNVMEGVGIGGLMNVALDGVKAGARALSGNKQKALKNAKKLNPEMAKESNSTPMAAVERASDVEYNNKVQFVAEQAEAKYQREQFKSLKKNGFIPEDMDYENFKANYKGSKDPNARKNWSQLSDQEVEFEKQLYAANNKIDVGPERDFSRQTIKQSEQFTEIGKDQLNVDLDRGTPRDTPYYYQGAEFHENQPLTSTSRPAKALRDQVQIRNDPANKYGANRAPMTEAAIRRAADASGSSIKELEKMAEQFAESPEYSTLYGSTSRAQMRNDFIDSAADLKSFLDDTGHSRMTDMSEDSMLEFLASLRSINKTQIEGIDVLNHRQTVAADVMIGQLTQQIRDLSKASLSVDGVIDTTSPGGILDGMIARYKTLTRLRAETSALSSYNLRRFKAGSESVKDINFKNVQKSASDEAAARVDLLAKVIREDKDGSMFEAFRYFTAASNGSAQTFKDMDEFFRRKLVGFSDGNTQQRNAVLNEMMTMGINSMLSGPKTPARAVIGTGIGTFMRPVAAIIGSKLPGGDPRIARESYAALGAMWQARGEAWHKAIADYRTYMTKEDPFRGFIVTKGDEEFEALQNYYKSNGTRNEQAQMALFQTMRGLNKSPLLNYGPRMMAAADSFFTQLIGRGRQRALAFNEIYDRFEHTTKSVSSDDFKQLVRDAENKFQKDIWDADGKVIDEMVKYASDEAKLTKELPLFFKQIDNAMNNAPFLKPFVGLFMKTGVNALEMTAKYTPILNKTLQESKDIMTKAWDDPALLRYGIKSPEDLANYKAVLKGREAIGFGAVSTAAMLYLDGRLTGNGPPDRLLRDSWRQAGWQPRSIRIGDAYVSYESLEPFNSFLSMVADVGDGQKVMGEEWAENWFGRMGHLLSANITNKTFLAGLMQLMDLLESKGQRAGSVAANLVNNQFPLGGLRNEIGKLLSPGMRELEAGFVESVRNRNLWGDLVMNEEGKLPYRYDILTGDRLNDWDPLTRLTNAILPFNINLGTSQTRDLLFRSGINLKQTFNSGPSGESLEGYPELKSKYQYLMGKQNIEAQLEKLFRNPQILDSILTMEGDRSANRVYEPRQTLHANEIKRVFDVAKKAAWMQLEQEESSARELTRQENIKKLSARYRERGNTDEANQLTDLLKMTK